MPVIPFFGPTSKGVVVLQAKINYLKKQERGIVIITMGILLVYLGLFTYFPIFYSLAGSFMNWQPIKKNFSFYGLANYVWVFSEPLFWKSLLNTLQFAVVTSLLYVSLGLVFATLIFFVDRFKSYYRSVFFLPVITSGVAVSILWKYAIYSTSNGILNTLLSLFNIAPQMWLLDEKLVIPCIIAMTVWKDVGYSILIFYAGLNEIPTDLFEAATIDGAGALPVFRKIIMPMVRGSTLLVGVTGMIGYLQLFTSVQLMTKGGPANASYTMMYLLYQKAFTEFNFGRASAVGYAMTMVILIFSVIQFRLNREKQ
jgi:multiple sugar transport system permease protein